MCIEEESPEEQLSDEDELFVVYDANAMVRSEISVPLKIENNGRVLLGSTVSGWFGWLSFFVFYWEETVFGSFGCSTFSTSSELG